MNENFDNFELQLSDAGKGFLRTTAKWASFLAILGFIGLGFMLIFAFIMIAAGSAVSSMPAMSTGPMAVIGGSIGFIYLIFVALYFFPVYYLYKFSSKIKAAFLSNDSAELNEGLGYLKSHYKFVGIVTIIVISLYILAIPLAVIFATSFSPAAGL